MILSLRLHNHNSNSFPAMFDTSKVCPTFVTSSRILNGLASVRLLEKNTFMRNSMPLMRNSPARKAPNYTLTVVSVFIDRTNII